MRLKFLLLLVALLGALTGAGSCAAGPKLAQVPQSSTAGKDYNFASYERLHDHWKKHVLEQQNWPTILNEEEYLEKARSFFGSKSPDKLTFIRKNGDVVQYNPKTNEFGVVSRNRVIRTFFRPKGDGRAYFERQKDLDQPDR